MIYATLDIEWFEDPAYLELRDADRGHPDRFLRCVGWAKRANDKGRVVRADGVPLNARAMARIHEGSASVEHVQDWESFLALALDLGILEICSQIGCFKIAHWRRWHRSPSDEPEKTSERQAKSREKRANLEKTSEQSDCSVTRSHELSRTVTDVTTQSRAEQEQSNSRANTPLPPKSNEGSREEGTSVSFSLIKSAKLAHAMVSRGYPWNSKDTAKLREFLEASSPLKPSDSVLSDCLRFAAEQLRWEIDVGKTDARAPWSLVCIRAPALVPDRMAWEEAVARHIKRGGSREDVRPFRFQPPEAS